MDTKFMTVYYGADGELRYVCPDIHMDSIPYETDDKVSVLPFDPMVEADPQRFIMLSDSTYILKPEYRNLDTNDDDYFM